MIQGTVACGRSAFASLKVTKMDLREWADELDIKAGSVVSVVGCGGKTTLVEKLSALFRDEYRVGVAATTKMYIPRKGTYDDIFIRHHRECTALPDRPGIYYFADEMIPGKIYGCGAYMMAQARSRTDLVFVEADGSKSKPLKGWSAFEPVIPDASTMTIGVITLKALGQKISENNVHRMNEFEKLAKTVPGETVSAAHICAMVNSAGGMFKGTQNKKVLLINQIDSKEDYQCALDFLEHSFLDVDIVCTGSLKNENVHICRKRRRRKVAAVILASGMGKRMQRNKLLAKIHGKPMIAYVLDMVSHIDFYERHIVTSYPEIVSLAEHYERMKITFNHSAELGQSQSVKLGTGACHHACDGLMFFTGDMPGMKPQTVIRLLDAFEETGKIIVPVYHGKNGNPVIFPERFKKELLALNGDVGGRNVITAHPEDVCHVAVADAAQGMDIDTESDLQAFLQQSEIIREMEPGKEMELVK